MSVGGDDGGAGSRSTWRHRRAGSTRRSRPPTACGRGGPTASFGRGGRRGRPARPSATVGPSSGSSKPGARPRGRMDLRRPAHRALHPDRRVGRDADPLPTSRRSTAASAPTSTSSTRAWPASAARRCASKGWDHYIRTSLRGPGRDRSRRSWRGRAAPPDARRGLGSRHGGDRRRSPRSTTGSRPTTARSRRSS